METATKKITKATIKSFINNNREELYIRVCGRFDGMIDGIASDPKSTFTKAGEDKSNPKNTLGVEGAWFVNGSRDYFEPYEDENYKGFYVYNCTGSFTLVIRKKKEQTPEGPTVSAKIVVMSHLSDIPLIQDPNERYLLSEFVKTIVLKTGGDLTKEIHPEALYTEFLEKRNIN